MALSISSKRQKQERNQKLPKSLNVFARQFAEKVSSILDESEKNLKQLIADFDRITLSQQVIHANQDKDKDHENDKYNDKAHDKSLVTPIAPFPNTKVQENLKHQQLSNLSFGQLNKLKNQLMEQLKRVDKQLLQKKLGPIAKRQPLIGKFQHLNQTSNAQKQNKPTLKPIKKTQKQKLNHKAMNQSRTLHIMDRLNNQKIKHHEEMIQRMKKRQDEEIKKIQDLEHKQMKIQLKRNRIVDGATQKIPDTVTANSPISKLGRQECFKKLNEGIIL